MLASWGWDLLATRDNRHARVQGRSHLTHLIELFEGVTNVFDKGMTVDVVYDDLVWIQILLT